MEFVSVIVRDQLSGFEEEICAREINEPDYSAFDDTSRSTPHPFPILPRTVT